MNTIKTEEAFTTGITATPDNKQFMIGTAVGWAGLPGAGCSVPEDSLPFGRGPQVVGPQPILHRIGRVATFYNTRI